MSDKNFRTAVVALLAIHLMFSFANFHKLNSGKIKVNTGLNECGFSKSFPCHVKVMNR